MESNADSGEITNNISLPFRETKTKIIYNIILAFLVLSIAVFISIFIFYFNQFLAENNYFRIHINNNSLQSIVFAIIILLLFILLPALLLIEFFPLLLATLVSYKRTGYFPFALESIIELQFLAILDILIIVHRIGPFSTNNLALLIPVLLALEYKIIKKPLISGWSFIETSRNIVFDNSDIIYKQSQNIAEFEDGYSLRPIFDNLKESLSDIEDKNEITLLLHNFTKFFLINGDLIAFDFEDQKIKLFLRTTFLDRRDILKVRSQLKKLIAVVKKDDLTCITIDLESLEINLRLNPFDYKRLENRTYAKVTEYILRQFKVAISEFKDKNYLKSYEALNPQIQKYGSKIKARKIKMIT